MGWTIRWRDSAYKDLQRLDRSIQRRILRFLRERVTDGGDPRRLGKALSATRAGLWRYRVGDYRIVCHLDHGRLVVLVVGVGHRREIYR